MNATVTQTKGSTSSASSQHDGPSPTTDTTRLGADFKKLPLAQQLALVRPGGGGPAAGGEKEGGGSALYCGHDTPALFGSKQDAVKAEITDTRIAHHESKIPAYHIILEQLAHRFAYHGQFAEEADDLPGVDEAHKAAFEAIALREIYYEKKDVVIGRASDFQATLFVPTPKAATLPDGKKLRPVVAFRGTDGMTDLLDDTNPQGIGAAQFALHAEQIRALCATAKGYGALPDVTGHSLGGALAQRCAARFPGLVNDIITFQAPGIDADEARQVDPEAHRSTHYRMGGDAVSAAGEAMTQGEEFVFDARGVNLPGVHGAFPLAGVNQDRKNKKLPHVAGVRADDAEIPRQTSYTASTARPKQTALTGLLGQTTAESIRAGTGGMLPTSTMMGHVTLCVERAKRDVERAITSKLGRADALARARAVVDAYTYVANPKAGANPNPIKLENRVGLAPDIKALIMEEVTRLYDRRSGGG